MHQFKNILVALGGDKEPTNNKALLHGIDLARCNDARLTIMDVLPEPQKNLRDYSGIIDSQELVDMMVLERTKELNDILIKMSCDSFAKVVVVAGTAFMEIIRHMVFNKNDLLIKVASETKEGFGSNDFHLMRKSPEPVWLIKEKKREPASKILAAIDLALESNEEGRTLNRRILELACALGKDKGKEVHALSCWSLFGESTLRNSHFIRVPSSEVDTALEQEERANTELQLALLSEFPNANIRSHLIKGRPVDHIPAFTKANAIDVVVMGTVARSGIPGFMIGNTSETILNLIDSSVLTLKPQGFESIIK